MAILKAITQSHLAVIFLDKTTQNPISRMPVYAEISVTDTRPSYIIPEEDFRLHLNPEIADPVRLSLAAHLDEIEFHSMSPEMKNKLISQIQDLCIQVEKTLREANEQERRKIIDEIVKKAISEMDLPILEQNSRTVMHSYPLGYLATDHAGYASFDLSKFAEGNIFNNDLHVTQEFAVFVYPMGKEGVRLDALQQNRLTKDAIFAKFEIDKPVFENSLKSLNLPSMQKPSLTDWYFSPGSFAAKPGFLIGEDGCEQLLPSQLALQQYNFRQVVRVNPTPTDLKIPEAFKFGYVDEYRASWYSLGHSLGEILYSLPLAPGESVKLAVIDWSWDSTTKRDEKTTFTEAMQHETHRDRTISETVKATLKEWQRGGSFMAGLASSSGSTATQGNASSAQGTAFSLGGGYSTSSGSRDLAAENVQRLSDGFAQASSSQRELNSTVVVQAHQAEKETIQTRTFTNYNHSHTLTILYYEVLRHFKVEVEWMRRRPVLLVWNQPTDILWQNELILAYRFILEPELLDGSLKSSFDTLSKLETIRSGLEVNRVNPDAAITLAENIISLKISDMDAVKLKAAQALSPQIESKPFSQGDITFSLFEIGIHRSDSDDAITKKPVNVFIRKTDGGFLGLYMTTGDSGFENNFNQGEKFFVNEPLSVFAQPVPFKLGYRPTVEERQTITTTVKWREIAGFDFMVDQDDLRIAFLNITGFSSDGQVVKLCEHKKVNLYVPAPAGSIGSNAFVDILRPDLTPFQPVPSPIKTAEQLITPDEFHQIQLLKAHLKENSPYYNRILNLRKSTETIAVDFEISKWGDGSMLIDHIAPFPLEVFGNYTAYPLIEKNPLKEKLVKDLFRLIHSGNPNDQKQALGMLMDLSETQLDQVATQFEMLTTKSEKLITLPTRGVFAEGKLGYCNISEEIDDTRFWKWEEHPIPFEAPTINPVTPVTPQAQPTTIAAGAFPAALLSIVNPTPAPDPGGMGDALKLLATANIFRDMSGRSEVADLLKKLSDNTISIAEAANHARQIQAGGSNPGGSSGGSGNPSGGSSGGGSGNTGSGGGSGTSKPNNASSGKGSGTEDLIQRANGLRGLTGIADAAELKKAGNELAKLFPKQSIFDQGAIASNDPNFVPDNQQSQTNIRTYIPVKDNTIVIDKNEFDVSADLKVLNWAGSFITVGSNGKTQKNPVRMPNFTGYLLNTPLIRVIESIDQIVFHETGYRVPYSVNSNSYHFTAHFCVQMDGIIFQFFDLCEYQQHVEKDFSSFSIGIEFTNDPWIVTKSRDTSNAYLDAEEITIPEIVGHGKKMLLPSLVQLESLVSLVVWLQGEFGIGKVWHSLITHPKPSQIQEKPLRTEPSYFIFSNATDLFPKSRGPGFYAHGVVAPRGNHADGFIQNFYSWLRINRDMAPKDAYVTMKLYLTDQKYRVIHRHSNGFTVTMLDIKDLI